MSSNAYTLNGKMYHREKRQGRKPLGLTRWTGRLFTDDLSTIRQYCRETGQQENDVVRCAVQYWRYNVLTELLKH